MDREDILQSVDPLLHGTGVEVVIDASPYAPQRPHSVHHQRHGEAERWAQLQVAQAPSNTETKAWEIRWKMTLNTTHWNYKQEAFIHVHKMKNMS